jgi:hypothetical protein
VAGAVAQGARATSAGSLGISAVTAARGAWGHTEPIK